MATQFPIALDVFVNPGAGDKQNSQAVPHSLQHANANDAIKALQAKVGIDGSEAATSLDRRLALLEARQPFAVGAIYTNVTGVNPATELGYGTWAAFGGGRMPVGYSAGDPDFDAAEDTGGAKTHALTVAEMPAHSHVQDPHSHTYASQTATTGSISSYEHGAIDTSSAAAESSISTNPATATNQSTGGGSAHNNMPPFIVVHFWKRTA